jgi:hypothetical protein
MGAGGGGSSGKVDYPSYMKDFHKDFLNIYRASYHAYVNNSPFEDSDGIVFKGFDPQHYIQAIADYHTSGEPVVATAIRELFTDWSESEFDLTYLINQLYSTSAINASIAAFTADLEEELDTTIYPKFEAGMRDINSIMSSAFIAGRALIADGEVAQIAKYTADLNLKQHFDATLASIGQLVDLARLYATTTIEANRIALVAEKEYHEKSNEYKILQDKWKFDILTYGGNLLASIGSASVQHLNKESMVQSAIGGALSGAAAVGSAYNAYAGAGATSIGVAGSASGGAGAGAAGVGQLLLSILPAATGG